MCRKLASMSDAETKQPTRRKEFNYALTLTLMEADLGPALVEKK